MIFLPLEEEEPFFRVIAPKWAHTPTSGMGAANGGGRFNRKGQEALYLARAYETAVEEFRQPGKLVPPGTLTTFMVSGIQVVDFSGGFVAGTWDPIWSEYACNWRQIAFMEGKEPPSWVLADIAIESGANGILFPSVQHTGGTNLVIFDSSHLPPENVRVYDPARALPRDQASWPTEGD